MSLSLSTIDFLIIFGCCTATILLFRIAPMLMLKGKVLPPRVKDAVSLIPLAAFAALLANDLLSPHMFEKGIAQGLVPLIAAAAVIVVARITRSLVWCVVVGLAGFTLLTMVFPG